ncbi:hypothetical protein SH668x_001540 [Planctomicrobium sp. SH668]|uniref:hypothetical protein n=1 Tax=Planctomicrobium sp. SH668 TaxID=3448126 RepID=UPI003F5CA2B2
MRSLDLETLPAGVFGIFAATGLIARAKSETFSEPVMVSDLFCEKRFDDVAALIFSQDVRKPVVGELHIFFGAFLNAESAGN